MAAAARSTTGAAPLRESSVISACVFDHAHAFDQALGRYEDRRPVQPRGERIEAIHRKPGRLDPNTRAPIAPQHSHQRLVVTALRQLDADKVRNTCGDRSSGGHIPEIHDEQAAGPRQHHGAGRAREPREVAHVREVRHDQRVERHRVGIRTDASETRRNRGPGRSRHDERISGRRRRYGRVKPIGVPSGSTRGTARVLPALSCRPGPSAEQPATDRGWRRSLSPSLARQSAAQGGGGVGGCR